MPFWYKYFWNFRQPNKLTEVLNQRAASETIIMKNQENHDSLHVHTQCVLNIQKYNHIKVI